MVSGVREKKIKEGDRMKLRHPRPLNSLNSGLNLMKKQEEWELEGESKKK